MEVNSKGCSMILLVYFFISKILLCDAKVDLLFFATPGGRGLSAGFYAGQVDIKNGGYPKNIFKIRHNCLDISNSIDELMFKSVTLDQGSGAVILHIGSVTDPSKVTLLRVPLCQRLAHASCDDSTMLKPVFINIQITTHNIVSFASYNNHIYFISETTEPGYKRIQLRNLTGCHNDVDIPYTANSAFYIESCSTVVATFGVEEYDGINPQYHTTAGLAIVPTAAGPVFYTQLQRFPPKGDAIIGNGSMAFNLFRVTAKGESQLLHEEYVTDRVKQYIIQGLGQITYRKGLLCWTALDRIVCAQIDNRGMIYNARTIMHRDDAQGVCTASPNEPLLSTVTTGTAIAKIPRDINRDEIALFFGCLAQTRGLGGSGLVIKQGNGRTRVKMLRKDLTTIYAGSMLVTDVCSGGEIPSLYLLNSAARISFTFSTNALMYLIIFVVNSYLCL